MVDFNKMELDCGNNLSPEEISRLNKVMSNEVCPECLGPITVGEYEYVGICTNCYFIAVKSSQ
jgi:uncharacterized CHY-type Zn-finger protein